MCDCVCNYLFVPKSDHKTVIIRPTGKTFITGIANGYSTPYEDSEALVDRMTEKELTYMLNHLNTIVARFWPCAMLMWIGYLLAPLTFGLSLMLPAICMRDAKEALTAAIARENRNKLHEKGLELTYKQFGSTSWMELAVLSSDRME